MAELAESEWQAGGVLTCLIPISFSQFHCTGSEKAIAHNYGGCEKPVAQQLLEGKNRFGAAPKSHPQRTVTP